GDIHAFESADVLNQPGSQGVESARKPSQFLTFQRLAKSFSLFCVGFRGAKKSSHLENPFWSLWRLCQCFWRQAHVQFVYVLEVFDIFRSCQETVLFFC